LPDNDWYWRRNCETESVTECSRSLDEVACGLESHVCLLGELAPSSKADGSRTNNVFPVRVLEAFSIDVLLPFVFTCKILPDMSSTEPLNDPFFINPICQGVIKISLGAHGLVGPHRGGPRNVHAA
jgi:hypothetical protein